MRRSLVSTICLLFTTGTIACGNTPSESNLSFVQGGAYAISTTNTNFIAGTNSGTSALNRAGSGGEKQLAGGSGANRAIGGKGGKSASGDKGGSTAIGGSKANSGGKSAIGGSAAAAGKANAGGTSGGSTSNDQPPPPIVGGSNGWASRYWDCCKPACGWKANARNTNGPTYSCDQQGQSLGSNYDAKNACEIGGGTAFMCWEFSPWAVSDKLSYGFAAASVGNYVCGQCYQLQFTGSGRNSGNDSGSAALNGKTMIVQVINNGGVGADQFDLLIPGGGVGQNNACTLQWATADLGAQYGGFLAACNRDKNCVRQKCQSTFSNKPDLMAGCEWFLNWYNAADNPNVIFKQIACPAAITAKSGMQG